MPLNVFYLPCLMYLVNVRRKPGVHQMICLNKSLQSMHPRSQGKKQIRRYMFPEEIEHIEGREVSKVLFGT